VGLHKNLIVFMATCIAVILVFAIGATRVPFQVALPPTLKTIPNIPEPLKIVERRQGTVRNLSNIQIPIERGSATVKAYPQTPLAAVAPRVVPIEPTVSLVLVRDQKKLAIIDGIVVNEGDRIQAGQVQRIESRGVLIRAKEGEKWLRIN
jgi:hypothetical protein